MVSVRRPPPSDCLPLYREGAVLRHPTRHSGPAVQGDRANDYTSLANSNLIPFIGAYKLKELTADNVDDWLEDRRDHLTTRTMQAIHSILRRAIRRAQARDKVVRNVATLVDTPEGRKDGRPSKAMTLDQAATVLEPEAGEWRPAAETGASGDHQLRSAANFRLERPQWDGLGDDWLEQALGYTAAPARGIRGPLSRIRPRAVESGTLAPGPVYRLADYLEQHGRRARRSLFPPAGFWTAAASFATLADLPALATAAHARGLYRDAARLSKHAAAHGDTREAATLIASWHSLHPHSSDPNPARWAVAHGTLGNPYDVADLLDALLAVGADGQAAALLARDPAAYAPLDDPDGVARLLKALRAAGAAEQAAVLADRIAAHATLDDPDHVARLLGELYEAGAGEQAAALADRIAAHAAHAALDNPGAVERLLQVLRRAGADGQAAALGSRAAAHAALNDPVGAWLLQALRAAGAEEQAAALLARDPAGHADLQSPIGVASLLEVLRIVGADEQPAVLLARDPAAHVTVQDSNHITILLQVLRKAGAQEQARVLVGCLPGEGLFRLFRRQAGHEARFRFGREPDGSPAPPWGWDDLD